MVKSSELPSNFWLYCLTMVPIRYNLRNLFERKATTLMTAFGIALTVAVMVIAMALVDGLKATFSATGDALNLVVMRKGSDR